jgi:hypothetical protein
MMLMVGTDTQPRTGGIFVEQYWTDYGKVKLKYLEEKLS